MPTLTDNERRKLAAYIASRDGYAIPGTNQGQLYTAACWSWALNGGHMDNGHANSADSIYRAIIGHTTILDPDDPDPERAKIVHGSSIIDARAQFPGCNNEFTSLEDNHADVWYGDRIAAAETEIRVAMMSIAARKNGLTPLGVGDNFRYTLHMRTSKWYGWDHWGIGIRLPPDDRLIYIQKGPNGPICHASNLMWDEHLTLTSIGLNGLLQTHLNVINQITNAPVWEAKCRTCNTTHGYWRPSVVRSWHQCTTCGTVWCHAHGKTLAGKGSWHDGTRTCGVCAGRTALI
ncbi:hypothetical protein [Pseudomonas sp. LB3P14]